MQVNRQFYVYKFNSSWLKEYNFKINISFEEALKYKKIISLSDNQMLRLIRDIKGQKHDKQSIEVYYNQRDKIKRQAKNKENLNKVKYLQRYIYDTMLIEEYAVITMESNKDYDYIFQNGLYVNNKKYIRVSCSAAQGRTSRVVFVEERIAEQLLNRLDNGRNRDIPITPSKYNAYLGISSSATKVVTAPRFCVIPDCYRTKDVDVWWVTETNSKDEDDIIERKTVPVEFNLFDGNGLITPHKAKEWADELELDYIPAQWCIRAPWIKGMVSVFDIQRFCKIYNNDNYEIETIYKDENGTTKKADLRDIDIILTESQFKLWNTYGSLEEYKANCKKNKLDWGVSLFTPKQDKDILKLNYQFIQTLNLDSNKVKSLCLKTVEYLKGVSYDNYWYTILFLMGTSLTEDKLKNFMKGSSNYWLKCLIANKELLNDKYIKSKINKNIKTKINNACMGKILVDGNFQVIVPDSFAFMEHACGLEVKGLIKSGHFYSSYWNNKNVSKVDCMRSPLTYLSEHLVVDLQKDNSLDEWFKYCYTGIITNIYDEYTLRFAGSDFDYDILATTSEPIIIQSTYSDDLPVLYQAPKPNKVVLSERDLQLADKFTFGSIIGRITNCATIIRTLMDNFSSDTKEYNILLNRMRMACKMQSAQIDKAKIGKPVKGIPNIWNRYNEIENTDSEEIKCRKALNNSLLCNKYPYFFIYLYNHVRKDYKKWRQDYELSTKARWGITLKEVLCLEKRSREQDEFIKRYYKHCPVIDNNSAMNVLSHYMENVSKDIKFNVKAEGNINFIDLYKREGNTFDKAFYMGVSSIVDELRGVLKGLIKSHEKNKYDDGLNNDVVNIYTLYRNKLFCLDSNTYKIVNCLVDLFYKDKVNYNKDILFAMFGKEIFENIIYNTGGTIEYPIEDENGRINYLGKKYKIENLKV